MRRSLVIVGVDKSLERIVLAAVAIQLRVSMTLGVVSLLLSGRAQLLPTVVLLFGAIVVFANTVFITREDTVDPITSLADSADQIADGEVDIEVPETDQPDEIGTLVASFDQIDGYFETVSDRADARPARDFDDEALGEDVPGTAGESLDRMASNLETDTDELQQTTERLEVRSEQLRELVETIAIASEAAKDGDLTAVSEQTRDEAERVATATQQQSATVDTVSGDVGERHRRTGELLEMLDTFDVETRGAPHVEGERFAATDGGY
jgi:methyl-accepting chemotaxis protein